ncbi:hypothetical protein FDUTEX481_07080 [Tolypothrix sp. PCC 7601]|nr:hypothetical protein FDUTEX481_07080 [Tolypothrix sp. PCC 7601]
MREMSRNNKHPITNYPIPIFKTRSIQNPKSKIQNSLFLIANLFK